MKKYKYDVEEISQAAQGRWIEIFRELAGYSPEIQQALDNLGTTRHTWCPIHKGKNGDAFRLFPDFEETGMSICNTCGTFTPFRLISELNGWTFYETLKAVANCLGLDESPINLKPKPSSSLSKSKPDSNSRESKEKEEKRNQKLLSRLRQVWKESLPLSAPEAEPVRLYFARRGLSFETFLSCGSLRFHPNLPYYNEKREKVDEFPTILGLLQTPKGKGITFHRIYITKDGKKAPVDKPKKLMVYPSDRSVCGAGVYLGFTPADKNIENIGVAEGIETALAVREATGLPMIAATNATLMEKLELPNQIKYITVWGDNDIKERGQKAVEVFCKKMKAKDLSVVGLIPPRPEGFKDRKSWDWNDVLVYLGPHYFKVQSQDDFKFE